jgi:hypothetical protein
MIIRIDPLGLIIICPSIIYLIIGILTIINEIYNEIISDLTNMNENKLTIFEFILHQYYSMIYIVYVGIILMIIKRIFDSIENDFDNDEL